MVQQPEEAARVSAAATTCHIETDGISAGRLYLHATAEEAAGAKDRSQEPRATSQAQHGGKVSEESLVTPGTLLRPFLPCVRA